jgi:hypothetical protein
LDVVRPVEVAEDAFGALGVLVWVEVKNDGVGHLDNRTTGRMGGLC